MCSQCLKEGENMQANKAKICLEINKDKKKKKNTTP